MKVTYIFLVLGCLMSCQFSSQTSSTLTVGVSSAPINPAIGSFIAGDKQNRVFTAVHDSLYAKAVVIKKENEHLAIVTLDCIGLLYPDVLRIRKRAAELCAIDASRIIVSSTHTHSGPDVVGIWGEDYQHTGVDSSYMNYLIHTTATQIQKAWNHQQTATTVTAETTFGEPWVQNICKEELDPSVSVMQFRDVQDTPIVTLTNFACHPTFLDAHFSEVSADYISGYYQTMNQLTGGESLFLQGAIGGWVQPEDEESSFKQAFLRGKELAEAVQNVMLTAQAQPHSDIAFKKMILKFPVENEGWKQLSAIGTINRPILDSVTTEICWFTIGAAEFATHPGETAPYYGLETKKLMGKGPKFIMGLGNDALGYILKPSFFEDPRIPHATYLTSMSVGKPTGSLLMQGLEQLIPDATE